MSDSSQPTDTIDRQGWRHCYECGARADVIRYGRFYKLVECRECNETSYIPKKCATAFGEFREFVEQSLQTDTDHAGEAPREVAGDE